MKPNTSKTRRRRKQQTLADLIATVSELTHNERLSAYIVADMINTRQVRFAGELNNRRVVVA